MGDHAHDHDPSDLPGDHDDPRSGSTMYWMVLMFVFFAASAFFLHGLVYWGQVGWEREGRKAPLHGEVFKLKAAQAQNLTVNKKADKLRLKSGLIINDGMVLEGVDPKDKAVKVFVKGIQFLHEYDTNDDGQLSKPELALADMGRYTLSRAGKELKFLPSDVAGVEPGKGNAMAIPYGQALKMFLKKHGS